MKIQVEGIKTLPDGTEEAELFTTYTLSELAEIANNTIAIKEDSTKPKVSLSFELNRSHILKLTKVSAEIIETLVTEIKPKVEDKKKDEKKDEDKKTDDDKKEESKDETKSEEKKEDAAKEGETKEGEKKPEAEAETEAVAEPKKEYKTTKVPHTYSVAIKEKLHSVNLLDESQVKEAKARIRALEKRDEDKF